MGLLDQFSYTNFHELNLDWILQKINEFKNQIDNIDNTITQIVQEYLQNVELNALYLPATESIVLNFKEG